MSTPGRVLVLLCALIVGALARDVLVSRAGAEEDALRRSDVLSIVRALEKQADAASKQADATRELVRVVERCGK